MIQTVVLCIGNTEGGDDGIGPFIAQRLKNTTSSTLILDAGTVPENFTGRIKQEHPETLILIDAAEMNLPPGEIRCIPREKIGTMHLSTHGMPLSMLIRYLENDIPHIFLIGIQPLTMHGRLSNPVKKSAETLITILRERTIERLPLL
jgi:hydrogenase 3 maturation protease